MSSEPRKEWAEGTMVDTILQQACGDIEMGTVAVICGDCGKIKQHGRPCGFRASDDKPCTEAIPVRSNDMTTTEQPHSCTRCGGPIDDAACETKRRIQEKRGETYTPPNVCTECVWAIMAAVEIR